MLDVVGYLTLDAFIDAVVPEQIRLREPLGLEQGRTEAHVLATMRDLAARNKVFRSYIGMGYSKLACTDGDPAQHPGKPGLVHGVHAVSGGDAQGRLEALLNFQTMVSDLTALPVANASLLDEGTAAAEAMAMTLAIAKHGDKPVYLVDENCHPQTIAVVQTRAEARGVEVRVGDPAGFAFGTDIVGCLLQYPATDGAVHNWSDVCEKAPRRGALVTVATDLLALALLAPPGEWGADIAVGNSQRFGCAARLRRTPRGIFRHEGRLQAAHPRSHHRRVEGRRRQAGAAHGAADARTAHPPRQGNQQCLHGAGAPRRDGVDVRGPTTALKGSGRSRARCMPSHSVWPTHSARQESASITIASSIPPRSR